MTTKRLGRLPRASVKNVRVGKEPIGTLKFRLCGMPRNDQNDHGSEKSNVAVGIALFPLTDNSLLLATLLSVVLQPVMG